MKKENLFDITWKEACYKAQDVCGVAGIDQELELFGERTNYDVEKLLNFIEEAKQNGEKFMAEKGRHLEEDWRGYWHILFDTSSLDEYDDLIDSEEFCHHSKEEAYAFFYFWYNI